MVDSELLAAFGDAAGREQTELEVALAVAQFIDPQTSVEHIQAELAQQLAAVPIPESGRQRGVDVLLSALSGLGYGRRSLRRATLSHSHLGWVLENREGLPITLGVVLMTFARAWDMSGHGINFPGHFLVRVTDVIVDPLTMRPVAAEQLQGSGLSASELERMLEVTSPQGLGLRMLNNIKSLYAADQLWQQVLNVLDCQLALAQADAAMAALLHFERGETWERLEVSRVARDAYQACLDSGASKELAARAMARIAALDGRSETLH